MDQTTLLRLPRAAADPVPKSTYNAAMDQLERTLGNVGARATTEFYIDPVAGNDATADGSAARPFKTWNALRNSGLIPRLIQQTLYVNILEGHLEESLQIVSLDVAAQANLYFRAIPRVPAGLPYPYNLFLTGVKDAVITTGILSGTATSGTVRRITRTGAGWTPGELRGKAYVITGGTNQFNWGRVFDNGVDWFEVSGIFTTPFDNTSQFYFVEEAVLVKPSAVGYSPSPLYMFGDGGFGTIRFEGIAFEIQDSLYGRNAFLAYDVAVNLYFNVCSLRGSQAAVTAGASQHVLMNTSGLFPLGEVRFDACDIFVPTTISGIYTGALWAYGPNGKWQFYGCTLNDNVQVYYGCPDFLMNLCSMKYKPNITEPSLMRTVTGCRMIQVYWDSDNRSQFVRMDGGTNFDVRYSQFENALGDGFFTYDHHGGGGEMLLQATEINGCSGHGLNIGGNGVIILHDAKTDPTKLNGGFGVKLRAGTIAYYLGTNTIKGTLGDVNLGDGVTPVANSTPATDTTHLTRTCPRFG